MGIGQTVLFLQAELMQNFRQFAGKAMVAKQRVMSHSPSWPPLLYPPPATGPHAILSYKSHQLLVLNSLLLENVRNFVRRNKDEIV